MEEILAYDKFGNSRALLFETLLTAYFVRTTKLLLHSSHEEWQVMYIMPFNVMNDNTNDSIFHVYAIGNIC